MTHPLKDQRAIITGASSGIGKAIACAYASAGAAVLVNYRSSREEAAEVIAEIEDRGGRAVAQQADISTVEGCEELFRRAENEWGGVDILVANAGIQRDSAFGDMSLGDWQQVLDVNLTGQFICAQAAVRCFRRQPFDPGRARSRGKIIFNSSVHQRIPWPGHANYAAAKGGLKLLMESLALEVEIGRAHV